MTENPARVPAMARATDWKNAANRWLVRAEDAEGLLRELVADARKAEHCPSCFDRHASAIIRRLLTRTEPLPATEDHPT